MHAAAHGWLSLASHEGPGFNWYWLLFIFPTIIAFVTPFYMMRCWTLTFWGKPRNQHIYDHAHETPILCIPLIVLAIASVFGGRYMFVKEFIEAGQKESSRLVGYDIYNTAWPTTLTEPTSEATGRLMKAPKPHTDRRTARTHCSKKPNTRCTRAWPVDSPG